MEHVTWSTAIMCLLGFGIHLFSRWGEFHKAVDKVSLWRYLKLDPPGWIVAVLSTIAAYIVLPEYGLLGGTEVSPLAALTAGYMGSSLGAKLPALFGKTSGVR